MALQTPFFSKREPEPILRPAQTPGYGNGNGSALSSNPSGVSPPSVPTYPGGASSSASTTSTQPSAAKEGGSKLTVGPNIKLKGVEITDCDTLVVEGLVEATMDSRLMQISEQGAFKGSAEIDIAEIHGQFDGNLTVRDKLMIYATGKVTGKIRYGKVVIEEGGQLSGEIQFGTSSSTKPMVAKPNLQVA